MSEVSAGPVLADGSGLSDSEVEPSDALSEVTGEDELTIDVADVVESEEDEGVTDVVDDAAELEVVPGLVLGCVPEDGALEEGAFEDGALVVTPDVVVDGAGFGFGSVACPQLTNPEVSPTKQRSLAPGEERRSRAAVAFTFA